MPNPGPASTISPHITSLGDTSDGAFIGTLSTTPISAFGAAGARLFADARQLTVSQGAESGVLVSVQSVNISPAVLSISSISSQLVTVTHVGVTALAVGDFIIVNKPTAQVGLGVLSARVTSANVLAINFANLNATVLTPTTTESYVIQAIRGVTDAITMAPVAVAALTTAEQIFTVPGVSPNALVAVAPQAPDQAFLGIVNARAAGDNQIGITFINTSQAPITPTAGPYNYIALPGFNGSNLLVLGANVGALAAINGTTTQTIGFTDASITVTGILVNDVFVGTTKPTSQGLGVAGGRIVTANTLNLTLFTGTVTGVTPTASEIYQTTIYRQNPQGALVVGNVTLAPVSVAAFTTAEQGFTVPGITVSTAVWVNKPSATAGLGIAGCRVSGANSLAITFINATATAILPPTEAYTVGNFGPAVGAGSFWSQQVNQATVLGVGLANSMRAQLAQVGGVGLINGS